ncbi:MAG: hypothetical protein L0215_03685 [Gemmataceae bacterium]|nr:hypothetical protein [Gemmataceae bacterium]
MTVQRIVALSLLAAVAYIGGCHHCGTTAYRPAYQVQPAVVSATPAPCCNNGQLQLPPPQLPPPPPPRY